VVDTSYLELVRLGVKPANNSYIVQSLPVVDEQLGVATPNGTFWHRYNFDGYGETRDGGPWDISQCDTFETISRIWPIFAGEHGEYELASGGSASQRLASIAQSGNAGYMLPEQVWDENPPSGQPGFPRGEGTFSATPLA
jgi:glucoamylase